MGKPLLETTWPDGATITSVGKERTPKRWARLGDRFALIFTGIYPVWMATLDVGAGKPRLFHAHTPRAARFPEMQQHRSTRFCGELLSPTKIFVPANGRFRVGGRDQRGRHNNQDEYPHDAYHLKREEKETRFRRGATQMPRRFPSFIGFIGYARWASRAKINDCAEIRLLFGVAGWVNMEKIG